MKGPFIQLHVSFLFVLIFALIGFGISSEAWSCETPERLVTKTFKVPINFLELINPPSPPPDPFADLDPDGAAKSDPDPFAEDPAYLNFLDRFLGPGCQMVFNAEEGMLEATNTPDQLKLLEEIVATFPILTEAEERALVSSIIADGEVDTELSKDPEIEAIREKMNSIRIPHLHFENVPLTEALKIITEKSVEFDIKEPVMTRKGVNVILDWSSYYEKGTNGPGKERGWGSLPVSFRLSDTTLVNALQETVSQVGGKYYFAPHATIVLPVESEMPEPVTSKYFLPAAIYEKMISEKENFPADPFADPIREEERKNSPSVKNALEDAGITLYPGGLTRYNTTSKELLVTTTQDELPWLNSYLSALDNGKIIFGRNSRFHRP